MLAKTCECRNMSMDLKTPRNVHLTAFYKRSFAYHSVKNRMPIILTQLLDSLVRNREEVYNEYGEEASKDIKYVIGEISKLKYEIQTNKPLPYLIDDKWGDAKHYNDYIKRQATQEGETTYFNTIWLLTECYMYRRIKQVFIETELLKDYDYYQTSKQESYEKALAPMSSLAQYLLEGLDDKSDQKLEFISLLKANLWGNKCDLSISLGKVEGPTAMSNAELEENILANQSDKIWEAVSLNDDDGIIDIILDNAGYEVFTDCCMADYILQRNLGKKIRFYVKAIPWFISDVMEDDIPWMIRQLKAEGNGHLRTLGDKWEDYLRDKTWEIVVSRFWTLPYEYTYMKTVDPSLYKKLSEAKLIFFKGDLNYRKLFGEINWDPTTPVEEALQGFHPGKLAILRTVKAHIVVGLPPGVAEECEQKDEKWNEKGDYGLIQFCDKIVKI